MKKLLTALLALAVLVVLGILFLFYRFGSNDARVLTDFPAAYQSYDQAVSAYSAAVTASKTGAPAGNALERSADQALAALHTRASARISSLTKNDGEMMPVMRKIGDISAQELDTLKAYQKALANRNSAADQLAKDLAGLTAKRKAGYALFLELAGLSQ